MKTVFIGGGRGCRAVLEMFIQGRLGFLDLENIAVVDIDNDAPAMQFARQNEWLTFSSIKDSLALDGLEMVIELTGKDGVLDQIYRHVPSGVRVMDHVMARVFWDLEKVTNKLREELTAKTALETKVTSDRARLQEILDTIPDVVLVLDRKRRIVRANRQFEKMVGQKRDELSGQLCEKVFCLGDKAFDECEQCAVFESVIEEGEQITRIHSETKDKERRFYEITASPIVDASGAIVRVVQTMRDITQKRKLRDEMIRTEQLAAVGKLAAGVAHELNNPLTGILTFAEDLLEGTVKDDPRHEDYDIIVHETLRCRRIVQDLLDYSRQEAPERQRIPLNSVVQRTLTMIERQASFHNIEIDTELENDLPSVEIDPNQIQQAILNLIINARDAMDKRGRLFITTQNADQGRKVLLDVRDTGCGISEEHLKKVFEPFYSTKGQEGNGLGLPAVFSVMEQHGGSVQVKSKVGEGSTFGLVFRSAEN